MRFPCRSACSKPLSGYSPRPTRPVRDARRVSRRRHAAEARQSARAGGRAGGRAQPIGRPGTQPMQRRPLQRRRGSRIEGTPPDSARTSYAVTAPIASAAQAPSNAKPSMAKALSGLRQRCRENHDADLRQTSMRDSSPDATMAWPRNLAIRHLTQRDGNRTTAHWTTRRAFVYARHRPKGGADTPLSSHRHPRAMTATARSATRSDPVVGLGRDHLHRSGKHTAAAAQAPLSADA